MKGILLAGGTGSRLWPCSAATNKHLLCVYDKPMIYYPLSIFMLLGIRDIGLVCTSSARETFSALLGDGSKFGLSISYVVQDQPKGVIDGILASYSFIGDSDFMVILGDNLFWGNGLVDKLQKRMDGFDGGVIFSQFVSESNAFGVVELDNSGAPVSIVEKPLLNGPGNAISGLYIYSNWVIDLAKEQVPSGRGELEISDLNQNLLSMGKLSVETLGRGICWLDMGTVEGLSDAAAFIQAVQTRQDSMIGSLEEIAVQKKWITVDEVFSQLEAFSGSGYGTFLVRALGRYAE